MVCHWSRRLQPLNLATDSLPAAAELSRTASALALNAISDAVEAFEQRELNDPKASEALLAQSQKN